MGLYGIYMGLYGFIWIYVIYLMYHLDGDDIDLGIVQGTIWSSKSLSFQAAKVNLWRPMEGYQMRWQRSSFIDPGIPTTIETMDVNITTIAYLRVLIIEIGSTIILMVVEAQGWHI